MLEIDIIMSQSVAHMICRHNFNWAECLLGTKSYDISQLEIQRLNRIEQAGAELGQAQYKIG